MKIIFCDSVMDNKVVERDYQTEFYSAKNNGDWIIVELGDGQVDRLPNSANTNKYYRKIKNSVQQWL